MGKQSEERDELEEKRKSYLKKLRRLGEDLSQIQSAYRKDQKKIKSKLSSYEEKLAKIDAKLKDI
jgi:uncharacterized protein